MLDSDQQKVVDLDEGLFKVIATAGAGKTETLLHRAARLYGRGKILVVTFTNESAKALRNRCAKNFPNVDTSIFSTLHALALKFAYEYPDAYPFKLSDNPLADEGVAARAVFDSIGDKINFRVFTSWVSLQKRNGVSPEEAMRSAEKTGIKLDYAIGYRKYARTLKEKGLLDFDDLLYFMCEILETRPDIRLESQFQWILVDESQDMSKLDWEIIKLLSGKWKNVLACGDPGQNLFSFRGSDSSIFKEMETYFHGAQTYYLSRNYRSSPEIVSFGRRAYPFEEVSSRFTAARTIRGLEPTITGYSTDYREAEEVVNQIKKYNPDECAILARTNAALRPFEEALINEGVKYHVLGDSGFWESTEVQHVLAFVRASVMLSDAAIIRAIQTPFWITKYIKKKKVVEELKQLQARMGGSIYSALGHYPTGQGHLGAFTSFVKNLFPYRYIPAGEAVSKIIRDLRAVEFYKEEESLNPDKNPVENLRELVKSASRFTDLNEFLDFVRRVSFASKSRSGVCLSTVHSAKGREWKHVFVVQCNRDLLPHIKAEDPEEEKNIFFVAVSRPKDTLSVSYNGAPSPFLQPWLVKESNESVSV